MPLPVADRHPFARNSYAIGQSAPLVATAWGVFYYGEFVGAPALSTRYLRFALGSVHGSAVRAVIDSMYVGTYV